MFGGTPREDRAPDFRGATLPDSPCVRSLNETRPVIMWKNTNHWYDGLFYDLLIAPNQDGAFAHVRDFVADGSTVLDVGCGTGRLALQLTEKCVRIEGIDPSVRNINVARRRLAGRPSDRVRFHHIDAFGFLSRNSARCDYATLSFVMHEIEEDMRAALLRALSLVAHTIIIVDYLAPQQKDFRGILNTVVEFAAGPSHYRNFKSFLAGNGLGGVLEKAGLNLVRELRNDPPSSHIVLAVRQT
jgi:SAM-dependent methyltransferase